MFGVRDIPNKPTMIDHTETESKSFWGKENVMRQEFIADVTEVAVLIKLSD